VGDRTASFLSLWMQGKSDSPISTLDGLNSSGLLKAIDWYADAMTSSRTVVDSSASSDFVKPANPHALLAKVFDDAG